MKDSLIKSLRVGTELFLENEIEGKIIGYIEYSNLNDHGKKWREYRLKTDEGILWLSVDENYNEYSISYPHEMKDGYMEPIWRKVDEGKQVVTMSEGSVDVEGGDSADFVEFEDDTGENIYSIETWEDGTEVSKGYYIDREEIVIVHQPELKPSNLNASGCRGMFILTLIAIGIFLGSYSSFFGFIHNLIVGAPGIEQYMEKSGSYEYVTSITGNEKQKAQVYKSNRAKNENGKYITRITVDDVAKDIIMGIEGNTESVTENMENGLNTSISILTPKEYCLVYYEDGSTDSILVQVSKRKYNYTSDNPPYRASSTVTRWYRSHYFSSAYTKDVKRWKSTPSAYTMYDGPIMHDLGNGYFDVYSNNIRQESVRRRNSSDGGINRGK